MAQRRLWVLPIILFFVVIVVISLFQPEHDYTEMVINREEPLELELAGIDVELTGWEKDFVQITKTEFSFRGTSFNINQTEQIRVFRLAQDGNKISLTEKTTPLRIFYQVDSWLTLDIFRQHRYELSDWFLPHSARSLLIKVPFKTTVILNGEVRQVNQD